MSKHWKPQVDGNEPVRQSWHGFNQPKPKLPDYLRPQKKRLKSLDEFTRSDFVGRVGRIRRRHRFPEGAKAGLILVAAACLGVAIGDYQAFGPREIIAPGAEAKWDSGEEARR